MLTGLILFIIVAVSSIPMYTKIQDKYPKHRGRISFIYTLTIVILAFVVTFVPMKISHNTVIGDAEHIYTYEESGTVYYDLNENVYFYSECSLWNYFHIFSRTDIDYELGKNICDAKDSINSAEYILNSITK